MEHTNLESRVLQHVSRPTYKPVKPRVIAKQLNLGEEETGEIRRVIKGLVRGGQLSYASNHLVQLASADRNRVTGIFRRTQKGFGFVRPAGAPADRSEDIYIPERRSLDAATGDTVLVRFSRRDGPEKKLQGEILEIIDREKHQFVGSYFEAGGTGFVQVDGKVFGRPILVGDPGAKNVRPDDKVVIEMVRFPSHTHDGEAVIDEVLGARGEPGVDTLTIIREHGLPGEFSEEVLESAREQAEAFDESIEEGRVDLTDMTIITIDPKDARDFDDAISLERIENDHWRLGVHIADVSHFVPPKTALDTEARDRATSVYLPDQVIPMLPETISNNLASLQPDRVRFSKTAFIEFTPDGARIATETCSAAIKSKHRFTYEEVDDYLAKPEPWKKKLTPEVFELLGRMHELAMMLRSRRFKRGSLELSMPEVKIDLDGDGRVSGAHLVKNTESHQIIEEFMLIANEAVAELLRDKELFFLRRIHEFPDPRKLKALTDFVKDLGIEAENLEDRFELQHVLNEAKGRPEEYAVNYAVLRSMQKAVYSPQEDGHFALASDCYCHFTSPIRRYPDLIVHRLLAAIQQGKNPVTEYGRMLVEGEHCSDREQRAEKAERELIKLKLLNYMSDRIGEIMEGVVTGVEDFGLFVQGIELPAEGLVPKNTLLDDNYVFDRRSHTLTGNRAGNSYRLGDRVKVEIASVDLDARELDFRIVGKPKKGKAKKEKSEKRSPKKPGKSKGKGRNEKRGKPSKAKKKSRKSKKRK